MRVSHMYMYMLIHVLIPVLDCVCTCMYMYMYINKIYREKSIPMIALWCPAFSNHG